MSSDDAAVNAVIAVGATACAMAATVYASYGTRQRSKGSSIAQTGNDENTPPLGHRNNCATPRRKPPVILAVFEERATLEIAQAHFRAATGTEHTIAHQVKTPNSVIWTTGCERISMDEEGMPLQGSEIGEVFTEERVTRFAGMVTKPLGLSTREPPRLMRGRHCASPGCKSPIYWPSTQAFCARARAPMRSDDCWYTDALIHSLGLIDRLESSVMLDLGRTYDHTRDTERFAETSSLTSDLDELSVCASGHIFGSASVTMVDFDGNGLERASEQEKDRRDDPDLKDDPRFCSYELAQEAQEAQLEALFRSFPGLQGSATIGPARYSDADHFA